MSDAQQGLPRYSGRGHLAPVAGALNLHADCIERLDEGLSVHTGSGRYIQGAGGTAIGSPRRQRGTTQNNYGDCKRFAMRIAKDTDDTLKLFIGKGGVQIDDGTSVWRETVAATSRELIDGGIVFVKYDAETKGVSLGYATSLTPSEGCYYARIGMTSKEPNTGQWDLPDQWLDTDAFFSFVGTDKAISALTKLIPTGSIATDSSGNPIFATVPSYSFECRVEQDGADWKIKIHDGIVKAKMPTFIPESTLSPVYDIPAETSTLTYGATKHIYVVVKLIRVDGTYTKAYGYYESDSGDDTSKDFQSEFTVGRHIALTNIYHELSDALTSASIIGTYPAQAITRVTARRDGLDPNYVTSVQGAVASFLAGSVDLRTTDSEFVKGYPEKEWECFVRDIKAPDTFGVWRSFRICSVSWPAGVPVVTQRQMGDIDTELLLDMPESYT